MKYICLGYIEDEIFRWADGIAIIGAARAQNSAKVGLDDRSREHRSLGSLYRVVVPTHKAQ